MTKLDILDDFEEVKIGVSYRNKETGEEIKNFPANNSDLDNVEVDYITIPGWKTSIAHCREFSQLPENAQTYLRKIEEILEVSISHVGVGQGRESIIECPH